MNWEYIVTEWNIYYTKRNAWDKYTINNQNEVSYKVSGWNKIDSFDNFIYTESFPNNVSNFFNSLWRVLLEKWNFILIETEKKEKIYIYNSLDKIKELNNEFIYSNILFEDRNDLIRKKTEALCNFSFVNNIWAISKLAKLESIRDQNQFIQNIWNINFIQKELKNIDDRLLEDLFLLWKGSYIWRFWKVYLYPFIEMNWKLVPIKFDEQDNRKFSVDGEKNYDKIDIIYFFEWKNKISLFLEKIDNNIIIFKEDVITEYDLQEFYTNLFEKSNYFDE